MTFHPATHLDTTKTALVYLRQSTPGQVRDNVVATQEQYRLREIPIRLGFCEDRIVVIDDDLGVSGQTIARRKGMLRVLELLEQGSAACVVVRDISRLTRDEFNTDIGLIARQCYQSGAVIVTPDKVYDPSDPSDQLMLGLQGLLAGWDRANIVRRLEHHRRAKQGRGININGAVPPGYEKTMDVPKHSPDHGRLRMTSDEIVRARITLILRKGLELGGVLAVVRYLRSEALQVPQIRGEEARVFTGADGVARLVTAGRRAVQWVEATRDRVTRILKNPTYAGAIVNGRRTTEYQKGSGRKRVVTRQGYDNCTVIRDAHEPYITWDEHLSLLAAIARNNQAKTYANGQALLSGLGLVRCGVCNWPMVVSYNNPVRRARGRAYRNTPYTYTCTRKTADGRYAGCQTPAGPYIDRAAAALVVFGLGELNLGGLHAALRRRHESAAEEQRRREAHVQALARRTQILEAAIGDASRPEARGRLVARFEEALAELEAARRAAAAVEQNTPPPPISEAVLAKLEAFRDPDTTWGRLLGGSRKEVLRALARTALVYPVADGYILAFEWFGGGRAAAKVGTVRRKRYYPVPEDVLALFGDSLEGDIVIRQEPPRAEEEEEEDRENPPGAESVIRREGPVIRRVEGHRGTARPGGPASPRPDAGGPRRR